MSLFLVIIFQIFYLHNLYADTIPVGKFEPKEWLMNVSSETYDYKADSTLISDIKSAVTRKHSFIVYAASWCGDSKSEVPKLIRIFEIIHPDNLEYFNLNRDKQEPSGSAESDKIERVPTLIVKYDNNEIGRIVEYPDSTLEYDINEILKLKCFK